MTPLTIPVSFVTNTVVDWGDVFTRLQYKQIVVESLRYCQQNKGLTVYAWVLMTNHLHLLVGIKPELHKYDYNRFAHLLSGVMRDFKKYTSKQVVEAIKDNPHESRKEWMLDRFRYSGAEGKKIKEYRFRQEGYYEEEVFTAEFM